MNEFGAFSYGPEIPEGPCRDCRDRAAGCHAECRRYQLYRQICRAKRAKRHAAERLDDADRRRLNLSKKGMWEHFRKGRK